MLHELSHRGCLRALHKVRPSTGAGTRRAVSLEVIQGVSDGLGWIGADYNLPTFDFALRSMCRGCYGEKLVFADLLRGRHVGPPTAYVSHAWTSPLGEWPGKKPLTFVCTNVLKHYRVEEMSASQMAKRFVWMDAFSTSQHLGPERSSAADVEGAELAIREAARRDGTLLVLDPRGATLSRLWCLLEVWRTVQHTGGAAKLAVLSPKLDSRAVQEALLSLNIMTAGAAREEDQKNILTR